MGSGLKAANLSLSSPDEVKWQVAFWAVIPLALGTMTQPVGRVFNMPPKYRFWLRSSPILCVGDILYFLIRVMTAYFRVPERSWRHLKEELAYRYRDEDWSKAPKEVEKAALGRWILILLGSIPCQTIKLMAMRGIPLTQTLAMMYFLSLVFGEGLNTTAEAIYRNYHAMHAARSPPYIHHPEFEFVKQSCHYVQAAIIWFVPIRILLFILLSISGEEDVWQYRDKWDLIDKLSISYIMGLTLVMVPIGSGRPFWKGLRVRLSYPTIFDAYRWLSETKFGRLFGIPKDSEEQRYLILFVFNFTLTGFGYAYIFDSMGTVNPPWVGIFG
ncbi:uncharacterized protein N7458_012416 [Penicillium daleae]|uniref:Uncharacterized protein n=1 Tax=Penicillium daleae TaxID=63821 RepID=A0AAD6FYC4_9EURO|nr:uncharacterized protein N7458_012416 [Penicillium daleae]KAJ5433260.1 hypothetical protein N7458_012416 [Penicillium daleae]